ncbi:phosphoribosylformylglycinamidine synthase subunit PurQ [Alistipes sp. ZOR0009]|uniref:phosphoribosylformylglycinamidine synthase subunit PurQ n=1 Tax=Alistipes sp. ZOR0009 TaxID=1339253 RepID=UPI000645A40C|nr:phosphoribosylformylglycinamidine synthase subunit PurQ [Alistipes sp. ZOR0009]
MRIGIVKILGFDQSTVRVMVEHFHNSTVLLSVEEEIPTDLNLVVIPSNMLYCESVELQKQVAAGPLFKNLSKYAKQGGFIVGIQSGFQILCQAGLLPGLFTKTEDSRLTCKVVHVMSDFRKSALTYLLDLDHPIKLYLSHSLGPYIVEKEEALPMKANGQILLRYCSENGLISKESAPDGSTESIAAICNKNRNIYGITPNPITRKHFQQKMDGFDLMDSFFKMITR